MGRESLLARQRMVDEQLRGRGIRDERLLAAFLAVERDIFVPHDLRARAYDDCPLPIGESQTISQPYMVALMTELLALTGRQKVLEIGTGSGYQTALLAALGCAVYSIEWLPGLSDKARRSLGSLGYAGVHLAVGDGTLGWPQQAPFDRILVAAGAPDVPEPLIEQLARGGRMVVPVGGLASQMLTLVEKKDTGIETTDVCECSFVPLMGKYGWKGPDAQSSV